MNFEEILLESYVNCALDSLVSKTLYFYNQCYIIKTKIISHKDVLKPWATRLLKEKLKIRHLYLSLFKQTLISKQEYNSSIKQVNSLIEKSKKDYHHQPFSCVKKHVERTWNTNIKVLKPNPIKNKSDVKSLIFYNVTYSNELEMGQIYIEHYSTVSEKLHDSIPIVKTGNNVASHCADI